MKKTRSTKPVVGIIMGSDSDWPTMKAAAEACTEFGIANEARVISAHRTPRDLERYASTAHARGLCVIIAGAGGAAHLPGVAAALTPLPVVGVPIESKSLKLHLFSYRSTGAFAETIVNQLLDAVVQACQPRRATVTGDFAPRGGIAIRVTANFPG